MRGWTVRGLAVLALSGCVGPEETRYLSCVPRPPEIETRAYDWHDPFPDETAGPDTITRPRAFLEPRTDTRKTFDLRFFSAMHPLAGSSAWAHRPRGPGYGNSSMGAVLPGAPAPPGAGPISPFVPPAGVPLTPTTGPIAVGPAHPSGVVWPY